MRRIAVSLIALMLVSGAVRAQSIFPRDASENVAIEQRTGEPIPMDLEFVDDSGRIVRLGDYFGDKPVVLTPVYYSCPMLCNLILDGMVRTASDLRFDIGDQYEVVTFSFDHRETTEMARAKKDLYTRRYGREGVEKGWHFLTADQPTIRSLMDAIGFRFGYDQTLDQYAHPAGIVVVTPDGKISRYFYGFEFSSRDLRLGLVEAGEGKVGSPVDQVLLLCYSYDPATGKYSRVAMDAVRVGGTVTAVGVFGFIFFMIRREVKGRH